jgi:hypothetical protein
MWNRKIRKEVKSGGNLKESFAIMLTKAINAIFKTKNITKT